MRKKIFSSICTLLTLCVSKTERNFEQEELYEGEEFEAAYVKACRVFSYIVSLNAKHHLRNK